MRSMLAAFALLILGLATGPASADDPPPGEPRFAYPSGSSTQRIEGLSVTLYVPYKLTPTSGSSLLVLLHGAGAKGSNLATFFRFWPRMNYVVCAPQATGRVWTAADLARVKRIVRALEAGLPIDPDHLHVAGFSNGASNLTALAFDPDLKPRSATWVGGGLGAGPVPEWVRTRLGALFMVGGQDRFYETVTRSAEALRGRARQVELRVDPDIGHTWPTSSLAYHLWWMGVMEGRFVPGDDENFDWLVDLEEAREELASGAKRGILLYVFDPERDKVNPDAKALQNEAFMDRDVRRAVEGLAAVKLERSDEEVAALGFEIAATPAVVLFGSDGRPREILSGRIAAAGLGDSIRNATAGRPAGAR